MDFTLGNLLRHTTSRVLGALMNFLFYTEGKLNLLKTPGRPRARLFPDYHERTLERQTASIAQVCPVQSSRSLSVRQNAPYADSGLLNRNFCLLCRESLVQHHKEIADHDLAEQMEETMTQQL
jgi:hypothetical protein